MGNRLIRIAWICCLILLAPKMMLAQNAPDRFAFVVGNSAYERTKDNSRLLPGSRLNLESPANDARLYVDALGAMGWQILNQDNTQRTVSALRNDLTIASKQITPGSEVVFIFNGHGFSDGPSNYVVGIPEDGAFTSFADMRTGSIELSEIVQQLSLGNPERIILIINACGDEPISSEANRAPAKPNFDTSVPEVLVLYASSPRGVAYDYVYSTEKQDADPILSVFTRAFAPMIRENRPLLDIFVDVRQQVERLSINAARDKNLPGRSFLQIPHILYDTINGQFNLANVADTSVDDALNADWRLAPQACRFDSESRNEALAIRTQNGVSDDGEGQAVRNCIIAAALGDMGIERLTYDNDRNRPVVDQVSPDSSFVLNSVVKSMTVTPKGERRKSIPPTSIDIFYQTLAENYFADGTNITFGWQRYDGGVPPSDFVQKNF
ncbi:caspase family protein [Algirhabdus cladophorae]|uniref:caspase family protein n=1 Tax=Algirhabdus cladophorae TaxID=3377108 RepID=UPI003B849325